MLRAAACLATLAGFLNLPVHAGSEWTGDFETGDLTQWSGCHAKTGTTDRLTVVPAPLLRSGHALRALVRDNDAPVRRGRDWEAGGAAPDRCVADPDGDTIEGGWRAEVHKGIPEEREGSEMEYSWSTLFPATYPRPAQSYGINPETKKLQHIWQVFTQWRQCEDCVTGPPPVSFGVGEDDRIKLRIHKPRSDRDLASEPDREVTIVPVSRGKWHTFTMRVRWSHDPDRGYIKVWHNGDPTPRVDLPNVQTLFPKRSGEDGSVHLRIGLHRAPFIVRRNYLVFHDDVGQRPIAIPAPSPSRPSVPLRGLAAGEPRPASSQLGGRLGSSGSGRPAGGAASGGAPDRHVVAATGAPLSPGEPRPRHDQVPPCCPEVPGAGHGPGPAVAAPGAPLEPPVVPLGEVVQPPPAAVAGAAPGLAPPPPGADRAGVAPEPGGEDGAQGASVASGEPLTEGVPDGCLVPLGVGRGGDGPARAADGAVEVARDCQELLGAQAGDRPRPSHGPRGLSAGGNGEPGLGRAPPAGGRDPRTPRPVRDREEQPRRGLPGRGGAPGPDRPSELRAQDPDGVRRAGQPPQAAGEDMERHDLAPGPTSAPANGGVLPPP